ncbi:ribonuclease P protein component [Blattabacterium cuenoti]|uniref:ribonuclease P protein component n=1 Tax=Blattabacterium cuenoti TaxID=1653831 RepID=UPI00163B8A5F|nr:ribonuclease P protein component [Blattabacterium cuenoti]
MKTKLKKIYLKKIIKNGKYLFIYPISSVFIIEKRNNEQHSSINLIGTLVKKKKFRKSVSRNRIKRLLKASFFLNKCIFKKKDKIYYVIFIYQTLYFPNYKNIDDSVKKILNKIKCY